MQTSSALRVEAMTNYPSGARGSANSTSLLQWGRGRKIESLPPLRPFVLVVVKTNLSFKFLTPQPSQYLSTQF